MGLSQKLLGEGEFEVQHMRTHSKAIFFPLMWLILLMGGVIAGIIYMPEDWPQWAVWVIVGVGLVLSIPLFFAPFLRWLTTTYTMTNRRIITRRGILNKTGHDIPLARISNVAYERDLLDRLLGCGTLVLTTAAEAPVALPDVPHVERVHVKMTELLFGDGFTREELAAE